MGVRLGGSPEPVGWMGWVGWEGFLEAGTGSPVGYRTFQPMVHPHVGSDVMHDPGGGDPAQPQADSTSPPCAASTPTPPSAVGQR